MNKVESYIKKTFPKTLRHNVNDDGTLIGLPFPYTVPCAEGYFNELFYWDTYFTNKALLILGDIDKAKNNVLDISYLINRFGYMPNGSRTFFLKRSQPPYFALMVDDIYKATGDVEFLRSVLEIIKTEYGFWSQYRSSDNGLNRYGTEETPEACAAFYDEVVVPRLHTGRNVDREYVGKNYVAEAESGWDFTPRFGGRCFECNPIDLNSNLFYYEKLIGDYEVILGQGDGKLWRKRAAKRAELINTLLWDSRAQVYRDYNYKTQSLSEVISAAAFMPYFTGLAGTDKRDGLAVLLKELECDSGLFATAISDVGYQWAYPNIWAPYHLIAYVALENYGMRENALRVAEKYVNLIENNFDKTGKLFEKYNGITGGIDAVSEYGTPEMLGWTAGVYMFLSKSIGEIRYAR